MIYCVLAWYLLVIRIVQYGNLAGKQIKMCFHAVTHVNATTNQLNSKSKIICINFFLMAIVMDFLLLFFLLQLPLLHLLPYFTGARLIQLQSV